MGLIGKIADIAVELTKSNDIIAVDLWDQGGPVRLTLCDYDVNNDTMRRYRNPALVQELLQIFDGEKKIVVGMGIEFEIDYLSDYHRRPRLSALKRGRIKK